MRLTKAQLVDLEIILDNLMGAFYEAEDDKRGTMTLQSKVGSRFHKRVERMYNALLPEEVSE